jgi:hypothetical protein
VPRREIARGPVVADAIDDRLGEPRLARAGEADRLADRAVDATRVADARDFLGRGIDDAAAPQHAVEAQERVQRLGLQCERARLDRIARRRFRRRDARRLHGCVSA